MTKFCLISLLLLGFLEESAESHLSNGQAAKGASLQLIFGRGGEVTIRLYNSSSSSVLVEPIDSDRYHIIAVNNVGKEQYAFRVPSGDIPTLDPSQLTRLYPENGLERRFLIPRAKRSNKCKYRVEFWGVIARRAAKQGLANLSTANLTPPKEWFAAK